MTNGEAHKLGAQFKEGVAKFDPRLATWEIFSKTFGFFQWKKKQQPPLTDENLEALAKGFRGEPL